MEGINYLNSLFLANQERLVPEERHVPENNRIPQTQQNIIPNNAR